MLSKLGIVEFNAIMSESPDYQNRITSHAVESGQDVSDHVQAQQNAISISGVVAGDDAAQKLSILKMYRDKGQILRYIGRNVFSNVVIESLSTRHNARTRNGFEFDMTLKQIKIARVREIQIANAEIGNTQTQATKNAGLQQPKEG